MTAGRTRTVSRHEVLGYGEAAHEVAHAAGTRIGLGSAVRRSQGRRSSSQRLPEAGPHTLTQTAPACTLQRRRYYDRAAVHAALPKGVPYRQPRV